MANLELLMSMYRAAVKAAQPQNLIRTWIRLTTNDDESLILQNRRIDPYPYGTASKLCLCNYDVFIFGAGKAVIRMCQEFLLMIDKFNKSNSDNRIKITKGHLNVPVDSVVEKPKLFARHRIKVFPCGEKNLPDDESVTQTEKLLTALKSFLANSNNPLIIGFVSGGGSALLCKPKPPLTLSDKLTVIKQLVNKGATIKELNVIRSRLSDVKNGGLAKKILSWKPQCPIVTFLISDIVGDPVHMIASGPTVLVPGMEQISPEDVIKKYFIDFENKQIKDICLKSSSTTSEMTNKKVSNIIIGNNMLALDAAKKVALDSGYNVVLMDTAVQCKAKELAKRFVTQIKELRITPDDRSKYKGVVFLAGGEITLNLEDAYELGIGGRCQELGLLVIKEMLQELRPEIWKGISVLFAGTDGQDGPTTVAGVRFDMIQASRFPQKEFQKALWRHDSNGFWSTYAPDCFVNPGPTGTNVMDIYCLVCPFEGRPDNCDDDLQTIHVAGD